MRTFFTRCAALGLLALVAIMAISVPATAQVVLPNSDVLLFGVTVGSSVLSLMDWAKRLDPDGNTPDIVEMLEQTNEILTDQLWMQGNLPTGHRAHIRTGLPTVYFRQLNTPVPTSKSTTAQVDEQAAMMEAWAEVDVELADLNGNTAAFRLSEAQAFIEAMNQKQATTLFYGNAGVSPEEFTGLSARYSLSTAVNGQNIIKAGGAGSDNMSIWLVVWGQNTVFGLFPKGSNAGLKHVDHGEVTVTGTTGIGGTRMRAYQDQWTWKTGLMVKDWRYAARIANIDTSLLVGNDASSANLTINMVKAIHRIPFLGMGKAAFYMNRTAFQFLDIQRMAGVSLGGGITYENVDGKILPTFRGIPIRTSDALLETEATVA